MDKSEKHGFTFSRQKKVQKILYITRKGEQNREHNFGLLKTLLHQHFNYSVQLRFLHLKKDIVHLEMYRDKKLKKPQEEKNAL